MIDDSDVLLGSRNCSDLNGVIKLDHEEIRAVRNNSSFVTE